MSAKGKEKAIEKTRIPLTNDEILAKIEAERVLIPAVGELFNSYRPKVTNRRRFDIQPHFNDMLKRIVPNPEIKQDLDNIDFVLMACCLFPKADLRELTTLLHCSIWLFLLGGQLRLLNPQKTDYFFTTDDEPGWVEGERMDPKKVSKFVERGLGIDPEQEGPVKFLQHNAITQIFENKLCEELKEGCHGSQLGLFVEQLEYFMTQAQEEMDAMIKNTILTMGEYRALRMAVPAGVGGVGVLLSLVQYAARFRVHRKITDVPVIKKLWDEAVTIVWLTIDLQNYKLKHGQELFLNAVIVYLKETGCFRIQTAADEVFGLLSQSISKFEQFAVELMAQRREYSMSKDEATIIIDGFRNVFVGNYRWITQLAASVASTASESAIASGSDSD